MPDKRLKPERLRVEKSPHATQHVGVIGVITTVSPRSIAASVSAKTLCGLKINC